jgi:hypothetical protein
MRELEETEIEVLSHEIALVGLSASWIASRRQHKCRQAYRCPLGDLADINGVLFAVAVKREEHVGNPTFDGIFQLLLPGKWTCVGQVCTPSPAWCRTQALRRESMV